MVNTVRKGFTLMMAALVLTACQDSPTASRPAPDGGSTRIEMLDALVVTAETGCSDPTWTRGDDGVCRSARGSTSDTNKPSGGGGGGGGGDTGGPTPPPEEAPTEYEQGPLLWAACVLGVVGSTVSIWIVSERFETWHRAYEDAAGAQRLWQVTVQNSDPITQQLYEYQYKQARLREQDAAQAINEATGASVLALGAAAVACGATLFIPTP